MLCFDEFTPTCPVILFERENSEDGENQIFAIHCQKLNVFVECYVNTAIIKMEGEWTNRTKDTLDCTFILPTSGQVTNVTIHIGFDRIITSAILSNEDKTSLVGQLKKLFGKLFKDKDEDKEIKYIPDLFRFPINNIAPGDSISIKCQYIEELDYYKKGYIVSLPLYFPFGTITESAPWDKVVHIECKIHALTQNSKDTLLVTSHKIKSW